MATSWKTGWESEWCAWVEGTAHSSLPSPEHIRNQWMLWMRIRCRSLRIGRETTSGRFNHSACPGIQGVSSRILHNLVTWWLISLVQNMGSHPFQPWYFLLLIIPPGHEFTPDQVTGNADNAELFMMNSVIAACAKASQWDSRYV